MTHGNIIEKFMIEYDKNDITSSYPSLTIYEIATFLDKAYNALISQKITGNNIRRSTFESDIKSISDLEGLVITEYKSPESVTYNDDGFEVLNVKKIKLPKQFLYFVNAKLEAKMHTMNPDKDSKVVVPIQIVDHNTAEKFFVSSYNYPWVKMPVGYIENGALYIAYDATSSFVSGVGNITYIKKPKSFVADVNDDGELKDNLPDFECSDAIAEELISLAISFALENVESTRLNSKLNTRGLEA